MFARILTPPRRRQRFVSLWRSVALATKPPSLTSNRRRRWQRRRRRRRRRRERSAARSCHDRVEHLFYAFPRFFARRYELATIEQKTVPFCKRCASISVLKKKKVARALKKKETIFTRPQLKQINVFYARIRFCPIVAAAAARIQNICAGAKLEAAKVFLFVNLKVCFCSLPCRTPTNRVP